MKIPFQISSITTRVLSVNPAIGLNLNDGSKSFLLFFRSRLGVGLSLSTKAYSRLA
jgi:hypothetical protein